GCICEAHPWQSFPHAACSGPGHPCPECQPKDGQPRLPADWQFISSIQSTLVWTVRKDNPTLTCRIPRRFARRRRVRRPSVRRLSTDLLAALSARERGPILGGQSQRRPPSKQLDRRGRDVERLTSPAPGSRGALSVPCRRAPVLPRSDNVPIQIASVER